MVRKVDELKALQPIVMKQLQTIYEKNRMAHAYIFDGEKGTGKRDAMTFFVKLLLCEHPLENVPCETCRNCLRIDSGNHPNIKQVEPDGQFIKIDQIRDLIAEMMMTGVESGRKVYVIHHADKLNTCICQYVAKIFRRARWRSNSHFTNGTNSKSFYRQFVPVVSILNFLKCHVKF